MRHLPGAALLVALASACSAPVGRSPEPAAAPEPAARSPAAGRHGLAALVALVPGARPGLGPAASGPSSLEDCDRVLRSLGAAAGCAPEGGWVEDEEGALEAACEAEDLRLGRLEVGVRLVLRRFELPGEDGTPRLFRLEVRPPADLRPGRRLADWVASAVVEMSAAHGPPRQDATAGARVVSWSLDDRAVVLVLDRAGTLPALVHLGPGDPELGRLGLSVGRRARPTPVP